jgi:peptide/nickel transport system substrate-binding protein
MPPPIQAPDRLPHRSLQHRVARLTISTASMLCILYPLVSTPAVAVKKPAPRNRSTSPNTTTTAVTTTTKTPVVVTTIPAQSTTTGPPKPISSAARSKISVGVLSEPSMDPAAATSDLTLNDITSAIYDTLLDSPIGELPKPNLADSITEAADRRSWTIALRKGVTFQDGSTFDGTAVKFNLDRQRKSRSYGAQMAVIANVVVIDPLTVRLDLDRPYAAMPAMMSGTIGMMVSPKAVEAAGDRFVRDPGRAGTGPYMVSEVVPGDHTTVIRNPNYWGEIKPRLEQIRFQIIPDESSRFAALQAGDLQAISILTSSIGDFAVAAGFKRVTSDGVGSSGLVFNTSKPPFDDVRMRRAVALAIDTQTISTFAEDRNFGNQGNGLWPKNNPWYSPGEDRRFDPNEARRLVNEYTRDTGRSATFTLQAFGFAPLLLDVARLQAANLRDVGIDAKVKLQADLPTAVGSVLSGQFEATQWAFTLDRDPDVMAFPALFSASPFNVARYKNPEMDQALLEGRTGARLELRKAAYAKVQAITRRDVPFLVGSVGNIHVLYNAKLCGMSSVGGFPARTAGVGNC